MGNNKGIRRAPTRAEVRKPPRTVPELKKTSETLGKSSGKIRNLWRKTCYMSPYDDNDDYHDDDLTARELDND